MSYLSSGHLEEKREKLECLKARPLCVVPVITVIIVIHAHLNFNRSWLDRVFLNCGWLDRGLWSALWNEPRTSLPKHHSQQQKHCNVNMPHLKRATLYRGLLLVMFNVVFLLRGTLVEIYTYKNTFNTPMLTSNECFTVVYIKIHIS